MADREPPRDEKVHETGYRIERFFLDGVLLAPDDPRVQIEMHGRLRNQFEQYVAAIKERVDRCLSESGARFVSVTGRAKLTTSLLDKLLKNNYHHFSNLSDLCGIRVVTCLPSEGRAVASAIASEFQCSEQPDDTVKRLAADRFGYRAIHLTLSPPRDLVEEANEWLDCYYVEVQIHSLLGHAWSELAHDRYYKFWGGKLPDELERRFAQLSAALEMIDADFEKLASDIQRHSESVAAQVQSEDLRIALNVVSLRHYLGHRLPKFMPQLHVSDDTALAQAVLELRDFGCTSLQDVDALLLKDMDEQPVPYEEALASLLRSLMIIADAERYFDTVWRRDWTFFGLQGRLLYRNGVDVNGLCGRYGLIPPIEDLQLQERMAEIRGKLLKATAEREASSEARGSDVT
ncbi:MAG: hypothetical protein ABFD96_23865 [Armatimonadia bacterium]